MSRHELSVDELELQTAELLPTRETLSYFKLNKAFIHATNSALAVNAGAIHSHASAAALQSISVHQS
jgi:hypothetical protein